MNSTYLLLNCRFAKDGNAICVYGVFDGFSGPEVADFASKKFPAELLLDQLSAQSDEKTVRKILSDTFEAIDREFFQVFPLAHFYGFFYYFFINIPHCSNVTEFVGGKDLFTHFKNIQRESEKTL